MKTFTKSLFAAASAVFLAISVNAITLDLSSPNGRYVGSITDGLNASSANETKWITDLIALAPGGTGFSVTTTPADSDALARSMNVFASLPTVVFSSKDQDNDLTLGSLTGIDYILGKYGNAQTGNQRSLVWYVGGLTGAGHTIADTAGLSHVSYFSGGSFPPVNPPGVPDGGSTVAFLGLTLAAVAFLKRKF